MFKDKLLENKTIVITGGGSGLGKSMARRFGELGANIVISGRRKEVLEETAHDFSEKNKSSGNKIANDSFSRRFSA